MKKGVWLALGGMAACWTVLGTDADYKYKIKAVPVSFFLARYPERKDTSALVAEIAEKNRTDLRNACELERGLYSQDFSDFEYNLKLLTDGHDKMFFIGNYLHDLQVTLSAVNGQKKLSEKEVEAAQTELNSLREDFSFLMFHGVRRECYTKFVDALHDIGMIEDKQRVSLERLVPLFVKERNGSYKGRTSKAFLELDAMVRGICGQNDISDIFERAELLAKRLSKFEKRRVKFPWERVPNYRLLGCQFSNPALVLFPPICKPAKNESRPSASGYIQRQSPMMQSSLIHQANDLRSLGNSSAGTRLERSGENGASYGLRSLRNFSAGTQQERFSRTGAQHERKSWIVKKQEHHGVFRINAEADTSAEKKKRTRIPRDAVQTERQHNGPPYRFRFPESPRYLPEDVSRRSVFPSHEENRAAVPSFSFSRARSGTESEGIRNPSENLERRSIFDSSSDSETEILSSADTDENSSLLSSVAETPRQRVSNGNTEDSSFELSSDQHSANTDKIPLELSSPIVGADLQTDEKFVRGRLEVSSRSRTVEAGGKKISLELKPAECILCWNSSNEDGASHLCVDPRVYAVEQAWPAHLELNSQQPVTINGRRPVLQLNTSVSEVVLEGKEPPHLEVSSDWSAFDAGSPPLSLHLDELGTIFAADPSSSGLVPIQSAAESMLNCSFARLRRMYKFVEAYGNSVADNMLLDVRRQFTQSGGDGSLFDRFASFMQSREDNRGNIFSGPIDLSHLMTAAGDFDSAVTNGFMTVFGQLASKAIGSAKMALGGGYFQGGNVEFKGVNPADAESFEGTVIFKQGNFVYDLKMMFDLNGYWHDVSLRLNSNTLYFENANFRIPLSPSKMFGFTYSNVYHVPQTKTVYIFGIANPGLDDQAYCCILSKDYLFFGDVMRKAGAYLLDRDRVSSVRTLLPNIEVIRGYIAASGGSMYVQEKERKEEKEKLSALIGRLLKTPIDKDDAVFMRLAEERGRKMDAGLSEPHKSSVADDTPGTPLSFLKSARISSTPPSSERKKSLQSDGGCSRKDDRLKRNIDFDEEEEDDILDGTPNKSSKNQKKNGDDDS